MTPFPLQVGQSMVPRPLHRGHVVILIQNNVPYYILNNWACIILYMQNT